MKKIMKTFMKRILCVAAVLCLAGIVNFPVHAQEGKIVVARLQVLRTFFSPLAFISSTLLSSSGAAKGPFLILLLIYDSLLTSCYDA